MTATVATDVRRVVMRHVRHLAEGIGPRLPGTARNRAAAHYIEKALHSAGLAVHQDVFPFPDWEDLGTTLTIGGRDISVLTNTFSPPCRVRARLRPVSTFDELHAADLRRSIVVLYGELARQPLPTKAALASGEFPFLGDGRRLIAALEAARPAAVLTVSPHRCTCERMIADPDLELPSATVPPGAGLDLVRHTGAPADLTIRTSRRASTAANVVARSGPDGVAPVLVCAHFDTHADGPGAFDNASGVAVLLTLANLLKAEGSPLPVEFVAVNGKEYWGIGMLDYVERHGASRETVRAVLNIDGVGQLLGTTAVSPVECPSRVGPALAAIVGRYNGVVVLDEPWMHSDHYSFAVRGIPCVAVTAHGVTDVKHRPDDAVGWLDADRLVDTVHLARDLVETLAALPDPTADRNQPPETPGGD